MCKKSSVVFISVIGALLFFPQNAYTESSREIMVSAAMSLKSPFEEIGKTFEFRHRGVKIYFNFGASGDLKKQIEGGAPADVFASASLQDMDELEREGRIIRNTRFNFVKNSIVLIEPLHSGSRLASFNDLKNKKVQKIAIGNPKTVPAGRYAEEVLKHDNLFYDIKDKVVFGEHARQVLDYVARGEVDAGIVYVTDAMLRLKEVRIVSQAPEESCTPAIYPIAVVKGTKRELLAKDFIAFVSSGEVSQVFEKYGFKPLAQ